MKYVSSGNGKMPLISLIAILSISLVINLPGLAVSPMLGKLNHIFDSSPLASRMVTSLPNLCIIPFVLLAGRFATPARQSAFLAAGFIIFLIGGIGCFFAKSMGMLIFLGCLVGVGCGLVVPIAAGSISEWFAGGARQIDLGLKSATSNVTVILATLYVGCVVDYSWRAAFVVYLIPLIPLALLPFMTRRFIDSHRVVDASAPSPSDPDAAPEEPFHFKGRASVRMLAGLITLYLLLTYAATSISYYSPFLMEHFGMSTSQVGVVTAVFYATCALAGATLGNLRHLIGRRIMFISLAMCAAGLLAIGLTHNYVVYIIASLVTGFGYGMIQPIIYNKTTYVAPDRKSATRYFGYVLSANYTAIMIVPFVDEFFRRLFRSNAPGFELVLSGVVVALMLVWALIERRSYIFAVNPDSPAPTATQIAQHEQS